MRQHLSAGGIFCRILGLALLGFVAISTAGVVLPLLAFAAVGFGIYAVFLYLWTGQWPQGWEKLPALGKTVAQRAWHILSWPVNKVVQFGSFLVTGVFKISWGTLKLGWTAGTEILCDAILGAALGVVIGIPMGTDKVAVAVGAAAGGLVGLVNGIRKWRRPVADNVPVLTPLHVPTKPPPVLIPINPTIPQVVEVC